jgi:light-harvesting protein B-800-850 alpha chain
MNQKEIWLVVKPTVGLPLFLGSVAVTALLVHYSILSHTTWFSAYWEGNAKPKAVASAPPATTTAAVVAPVAAPST